MPSLSYDSTGVRTSVKHGVSGILLDPSSSHPDVAFAEIIETWYENASSYNKLVIGSRRYFENIVNWGTGVNTLITEIKECLKEKSDENYREI